MMKKEEKEEQYKNQIIECQKEKEGEVSKRKVWSAVLPGRHFMYFTSKIFITMLIVIGIIL